MESLIKRFEKVNPAFLKISGNTSELWLGMLIKHCDEIGYQD